MISYEKMLQEFEILIRSGQDQRVTKQLSALNMAQVPDQWRLPFANICRRISQISMGLRLLTPLVRSNENKMQVRATPAERAEYAILLQRAGSVREALSILESIDAKMIPAVSLYTAFCHFNLWEYERALPHLRTYLDTNLDPYQNLVARVNLGAALLTTNHFQDAKELLFGCIDSARQGSFRRLEGNCHELLSQVHILGDDLEAASASVHAAELIFDTPESLKGLEKLLTEKCRAFLDAKLAKSTEPLLKFRERVVDWGHAETLRETDLFTLMVNFDAKKFEHLYFGTPFPAYRERIENYLGQHTTPSTYTWGSDLPAVPRLDLVHEGTALRFGSSVHRTLHALTLDFYRANRSNSLFGLLFPNEYFNIFTSPTRLHQNLRRTRIWLKENHIPAEILKTKNGFILKVRDDYGFLVSKDRGVTDPKAMQIEKLRALFPEGGFSAADARKHLDLSNSGTQRLLRWAVEQSLVESFGASTSTTYYFCQPSRQSAKAAC